MYSSGVSSPIEQDPCTGCDCVRCSLMGDVVDMTDLEAQSRSTSRVEGICLREVIVVLLAFV